jgi:hypothetical protein
VFSVLCLKTQNKRHTAIIIRDNHHSNVVALFPPTTCKLPGSVSTLMSIGTYIPCLTFIWL